MVGVEVCIVRLPVSVVGAVVSAALVVGLSLVSGGGGGGKVGFALVVAG